MIGYALYVVGFLGCAYMVYRMGEWKTRCLKTDRKALFDQYYNNPYGNDLVMIGTAGFSVFPIINICLYFGLLIWSWGREERIMAEVEETERKIEEIEQSYRDCLFEMDSARRQYLEVKLNKG